MSSILIPGLQLPIHTIFCIGRNYLNHAKEMNAQAPKEPLVFIKPLSTIAFDEDTVLLPSQSKNVHHEVEIVFAIGKTGKNISVADAHKFIAGFGVGIDFTARDIQKQAKNSGTPWTISKGFDGFAPISEFTKVKDDSTIPSLRFELLVNGKIKQSGNTDHMIFDIASLVSYLSTICTLTPGDLIFTGTPEGVSRVEKGDILTARILNDLHTLNIKIG